jgi:hypothetical protein
MVTVVVHFVRHKTLPSPAENACQKGPRCMRMVQREASPGIHSTRHSIMMPKQVSRAHQTTADGTRFPGRADAIFASASFQPILYLVLFLVCYLAYRGSLDNWLFNDDFSWLREARDGMTWHNVLTFQVVEFFRPLVNLSFFVMERLWPGNVPIEHALSIVLHFLCAALVLHLVMNLTRSRYLAAVSAILFAVTSIHSAAVLWISARTTLISTFFLLASIVVLTAPRGRERLRVAAATALYALALASKEEAIVAVALVLLVFFLERGPGSGQLPLPQGERPAPARRIGPAAVISFAVVSGIYLFLRTSVMGGFFRENWGPGAHALQNLGGGFLYQFYPWPVFSLFYPRAGAIAQPSSPLVPEIFALPLAGILIWIGVALKKRFEMGLAVGWTALAVAPECPFRYRFFSTDSISHDRYYYLSSVGSTLAIAILLGALWNSRARFGRSAAVALFILLAAGSVLRIGRLERRWDDFTKMYREVVETIVEESDRFPGVTTIAVEGSPLAFPYLEDALGLERPAWKVVEANGGRAAAAQYAPCLYISYTGTKPKLMRVAKIEGGATAR